MCSRDKYVHKVVVCAWWYALQGSQKQNLKNAPELNFAVEGNAKKMYILKFYLLALLVRIIAICFKMPHIRILMLSGTVACVFDMRCFENVKSKLISIY